jgi:dTDP-4-amino-4,6-dideoxygalactose transaminase
MLSVTNVTRTYLPPFEEYAAILKRAWDQSWITNNGELVQELEQRLKEYLGVRHLLFTTNGTIVLQMALKAYGITKEVITSPFSYVATTNAILWEGCTPVFVDINEKTYCIDAEKIEEAITEDTEAILATHVYGLPCPVEKIEKIAAKHKIKVIYDGAHAFGCFYNKKSLLSYGDISTCSFHATKVFHTVEGGCIITSDDDVAHRLMLFRQFGHVGDDYYSIGVNGKNSEFHAAMGLAVLPKVNVLIEARKKIIEKYLQHFNKAGILSPVANLPAGLNWNYSYFPVAFKNEEELLRVSDALKACDINGRRYFYPSLNRLPYLSQTKSCEISEQISKTILALPLAPDLEPQVQEKIIEIVLKTAS